jgi:hypothetical protein
MSTSAAFGRGRVPGFLPRPQPACDLHDNAVPNTPAKTGTGLRLVAPRMWPQSCCPPSVPEPLVPVTVQAQSVITQHQAQRTSTGPDTLMNHLVYDSLQPSAAAAVAAVWPAVPGDTTASASASLSRSSSSNTSSRTGTSAGSTRSNSTVGEGSCTPSDIALGQPASGQAAGPVTSAERFAYAPGLPPWYVPQGPADSTLVFESRFESGNLRRAVQVTHPNPLQVTAA